MKFIHGPIVYGETPSIFLLATIDQDGDKRCKPIATAFVVFSGLYIVLVTAAHAFKGMNGKPVLAIGPAGAISLAKAKIVKSDSFDVAVVFLGADDLEKIGVSCRCAEAKVISDVSDSAVDSIYQMHGFPAAKNVISNKNGLDAFQVRISFGKHVEEIPLRSAYKNLDSSPFCFEISLKNLFNDDWKRDFRIGSLKGLSGSPVIRHSNEKHGAGFLIGMFIEWHKQSNTAVVVPWVEIDRLIEIAVTF